MSEEEHACPSCGVPVRTAALFCGACGADLIARRAALDSARRWTRFAPVLRLWVILVVAIGVTSLLCYHAEITTPLVDVVITIFSAEVIVWFCWGDRATLIPLLTHSGFTYRTWWYPTAALAGFVLFAEVYFGLFRALGGTIEDYLVGFREHGWPLWSAFLLISVAPAVFEELAFRGFILGRLLEVTRPGEAMFLQAAMFSILHLSPLIFISHFIMGLVFGWLAVRTKSLYPSMMIHAAWNAVVLVQELTRT